MESQEISPARVRIFQVLLLVASGLLTFALLSVPFSLRPSSVTVGVGDVAPRDLQAPRDVEYVSEVRTEDARLTAERAVQPVYAPPDPAIARQQIERMRTVLQYVSLVREDPNSTPGDCSTEGVSISGTGSTAQRRNAQVWHRERYRHADPLRRLQLRAPVCERQRL